MGGGVRRGTRKKNKNPSDILSNRKNKPKGKGNEV